jgi:1-acyl-sn-glycerol-3-phosphate acyltransferase
MTNVIQPDRNIDWRDTVTWYTSETATCRVFKGVAGIYLRPVAQVECIDFEHIPPTGPCIVASNHTSNFDVCYLALYLPRHPHFMAKIELYKNPIVAWGIRMCGAFPVHRGENDAWALRQAGRVLTDGQILSMFPEGTRSKTKKLGRGKMGSVKLALEYGAPIVPIAITGTQNFRPLTWRRNKLRLQAGEPLDVAALAGSAADQPDTLRQLTTLLMQRIAAMLPLDYRGVYA